MPRPTKRYSHPSTADPAIQNASTSRLFRMRRLSSTVVVTTGETEAVANVVSGLDRFRNVRAQLIPVPTADEPHRPANSSQSYAKARSARELIVRAPGPYVVHDADPLGPVADAWLGLFEGRSTPDRLDIAVEETIRGIRAGELFMPDYYTVLDPESLSETRRHWWLGVMSEAAPARVVPAPAAISAVRDTLANLPMGRWGPDPPDEWLRGLRDVVPDQAGRFRVAGDPVVAG
jgi:hypothetical protein